MLKREVAKALAEVVNINKEDILKVLEKPRYSNLGDVSFPCFVLARQLKKNPVVIANDLAKKFLIPPKGIKEVKQLGAYINFYMDKTILGEEVIGNIQKQEEKYGSTPIGKGKTIVLEFSSPNIAKPMSIGHLRSTLIGNSLNKILTFTEHKCITINYLGDYGTQFGKLLSAYKRWGKEVEEEMKTEPIRALLRLYVKFSAEAEKDEKLNDEARLMFKLLEKEDSWAKKLWKNFRDLSLKEFEKFYEILGVKFDVISGESQYRKRAQETLKELKEKKIAILSQKAWIVPFEKYGSPLIVQKSDGTTLYSTRDIAAAKSRYNQYKFDKMIYVVGSEQNLHFKQFFDTLKLMDIKWADRCEHVNFGMIYFPGEKMSTRKGNVIFLEDVLNKVFELTRKFVEKSEYSNAEKEKIAKVVGVSALIYGDLSNDRIKDIKFDWSTLLRVEGNSGPYLQYTYARAKSILRKLKSNKGKFQPTSLAPEEEVLITDLLEFPEVVKQAAEKLQPNLIANHISKLADHFNTFYEKHNVMKAEKQTQQTRLALTSATAQVLKNGMLLLGMTPLERM